MLRPRVPAWAIWAGIPEPVVDEDFSHYVTRLGLDPEEFLDGLTEYTAYIANRRLATHLLRNLPLHYEAYIAARRRMLWHPPE